MVRSAKMPNSEFARALRRLNPEQLRAVQTIEGPVMVLAGPGTGKTQVVAMRIAQILQQTQLGAQNVLALTFTEAGVAALKQRLTTLIGEDAYRVTVATFHGFARQVIETFPYVFAKTQPINQLGDLERFVLLEEIVAGQSLKALQPIRAPRYFLQEISQAIRQCKQEAVTPENLQDLAEQEYQVGQATKLTKVAAAALEAAYQRRLELARVLGAYQAELTARSLYDYEDLILLVTDALQNDVDVRSYFQERYQYLLVDEYQDTNNAQNALVEALADFFTRPNLFVVGDDKQAIYRFQGASVANLLHFQKRYPDIAIISLKENYRSTPEILAVAEKLISHNQHQITQYLPNVTTALMPTRPSGATPRVVTLDSALAEQAFIIETLQKLSADGVAWPEMAVLWRTNAQARQLRQFLLKNDIPVAASDERNLFGQPEIALFLQILTAVADPLNNQAVTAAMQLLVGRDTMVLLLETVRALPSRRPLLALLAKVPNAAIAQAANQLLSWHERAQKLSVGNLLEAILQEANYLEQTRAEATRIDGLELYSALLQSACDFTVKRPTANVADWLAELSLATQYGITVSVPRLIPQESGVFVGTVHSAKGLEFRAVIMAGSDEKNWLKRHQRQLITLPAAVTGLQDWHEHEEEDERRLFYVGLTRAKEQLYYTLASSGAGGGSLLPAQFIAEIFDRVERIEPTLPASTLAETAQTRLVPIKPARLAANELAYVRERIASNAFAFSDLRAYQLCPKQYLLSRVLRLPSLPNPAIDYGNAVHKALELFFREFKAKKTLPTAQRLQEQFRQALLVASSPEERERFAEHGQAILAAYYQQKAETWVQPVGIEYSFTAHQVRLNNLWITGKFDRIDPIDPVARLVRVIDYKTASTAKSRNDIEGKTKSSDGDYKKQLVFYALLAQADRLFPYRIKEFEISFIDDKQTFKSELFEITAHEIKALAEEVAQVHQEILTRTDFPHTRDEFDRGCELCAAFPSLFGQ